MIASLDPGLRPLDHRVCQAPEHVTPGEDLAERRLDAAELLRTGQLGRPQRQAGYEVELDG